MKTLENLSRNNRKTIETCSESNIFNSLLAISTNGYMVERLFNINYNNLDTIGYKLHDINKASRNTYFSSMQFIACRMYTPINYYCK